MREERTVLWSLLFKFLSRLTSSTKSSYWLSIKSKLFLLLVRSLICWVKKFLWQSWGNAWHSSNNVALLLSSNYYNNHKDIKFFVQLPTKKIAWWCGLCNTSTLWAMCFLLKLHQCAHNWKKNYVSADRQRSLDLQSDIAFYFVHSILMMHSI